MNMSGSKNREPDVLSLPPLRSAILVLIFSLVSAISSPAQQATESQEPAAQQPGAGGGNGALQKAAQNPVANLISVPIQNNSNFGVGPNDRTQNVLNIQPVIPIRATQNWNLIIRWITPIIWQPAPGTANLEVFDIEESTPPFFAAQAVQKSAGVFGLGDMTPSFFFSPQRRAR